MTQDNGHTAGPWEIGDDGPIHYKGNVRPCWNIYGPDRIVASVEHFDGDDFPNANARLIAAAPEQLGIIKEFIEWVDRFTGTLPEAQSDALFDIYRRARATYRNVDQVAHEASREAALLQARGEAG